MMFSRSYTQVTKDSDGCQIGNKEDEPCDCPNLPGVFRLWFWEKEARQGSRACPSQGDEAGHLRKLHFLEPGEIPFGIFS